MKRLEIYLVIFSYIFHFSQSTFDINRAELQMVADSLTSNECRRLVMSLRQDDYILNNFPSGDDEPKGISCHRLLQHWNTHEGKDKSFHILALRLEQMGKTDIADKLSWSVNHEVSNELREDLHLPLIEEPTEHQEDTLHIDISHMFAKEQTEAISISSVHPVVLTICSCILVFVIIVILVTVLRKFLPDIYERMRVIFYQSFTGYPPPPEYHYLCC